MTVTASETRRSFNGNGVTTAFSYGYKFFANADLKIYVVKIADGTFTEPVLDTDYTVSGALSDAGGTVTFMVAPATGYKVVIINNPAAIQDKNYVNADDFPAESHEDALDRLTKLVQRLQDQMARTAQIPDTSDDVPPDPQAILDAATQSGLDAIATAADRVATAADVVSTHADAASTADDAAATAADAVATAADRVAVHADKLSADTDAATATTQAGIATTKATATAADAAATAADVVLTHADAVATAADRVQTGLDRIAAAASAASLVNVLTLIGTWDASSGVFPGVGTVKKGWTYIINVAGTTGGVAFGVDDKLVALVDNPSTGTYAANWSKIEGGTIVSAQVVAALGFTPADSAVTISAGGIATGGGSLAANRTITVTKATGAEVTTGTDDTHAVTPKALVDAGITALSEATDAEIWAGTLTNKVVTPRRLVSSKAWQALADAATILVDSNNGRNFKLTSMAGNRTLGNISNAQLGETYTFAIKQDATGSRTLAYASNFTHDGDSPVAIGTTASKWSIISVTVYDATHHHVQLIAVNVSLG